MTNGQSGCFMWMVLLTGGMMFFIAVDKGCLSVGDPTPSPRQVQFEAPIPVQPRPYVRTTPKPGPLPVTPKVSKSLPLHADTPEAPEEVPEGYVPRLPMPKPPKDYVPPPKPTEDPTQVEYR